MWEGWDQNWEMVWEECSEDTGLMYRMFLLFQTWSMGYIWLGGKVECSVGGPVGQGLGRQDHDKNLEVRVSGRGGQTRLGGWPWVPDQIWQVGAVVGVEEPGQ